MKKTPRQEYRDEHPEEWAAAERQIERLREIRDGIQKGDKIVLVGPNASGKSLLRAFVPGGAPFKDKPLKMVHASMALRTGSFASLGALSNMFNDSSDAATGVASLSLIEGAIRNCSRWVSEGNHCGLHIDEPEVGCSEELQLGMAPWLREQLDEMATPAVTILTTHSRIIVSSFTDWKFIDTSGEHATAESWLTRKIKPLDLTALKERAHTMRWAIYERQDQMKKSKG